MAFHGFVIIKIPLYDQPSISVDMHMSGRVIAFPPDNDVPTAAEFAHSSYVTFRDSMCQFNHKQGCTVCLRNGSLFSRLGILAVLNLDHGYDDSFR
jgi:hypothetical protein